MTKASQDPVLSAGRRQHEAVSETFPLSPAGTSEQPEPGLCSLLAWGRAGAAKPLHVPSAGLSRRCSGVQSSHFKVCSNLQLLFYVPTSVCDPSFIASAALWCCRKSPVLQPSLFLRPGLSSPGLSPRQGQAPWGSPCPAALQLSSAGGLFLLHSSYNSTFQILPSYCPTNG